MEDLTAWVDRFAAVRVCSVQEIGIFLDCGQAKDLFMPYAQTVRPLRVGETIVVRILFDDVSGRVIASHRLKPFLRESKANVGDKLDCLVYEVNEFGARVITEDESNAMVQMSEFSRLPKVGDVFRAFVREIREDKKMTLTLAPMGLYRNEFRDEILSKIDEFGGCLPLHDNSRPEEIRDILDMSKKSFKKLAGNLLKAGKIYMDENGIYRK